MPDLNTKLTHVRVPDLEGGATQANIIGWKINEGDPVNAGDHLLDIETTKAAIEVPSPVSGVLVRILKKTGDEVAPGDVIAEVGSEEVGAKPETQKSDSPPMAQVQESIGLPFAMPAAQKILTETGIDPATISGSGKGGRIVKSDVVAAGQVSGNAKRFDVVVIGGGPGGYVAAIRAAQLGFSVACIEKETYGDPDGKIHLGGTCLNVGCIPSKSLLESSHHFESANHSFASHGISVGDIQIDVTKMIQRKKNIVEQLTQGIRGLFRKNKVTLLEGHGQFIDRSGEYWQLLAGQDVIEARHVIVATGSRPRHLPGTPVDNIYVCDNAGALAFSSVPKRLGIIGAGVIGLELGSVWKRLGSDVQILEADTSFLSSADEAVAKEASKMVQAQGLKLELGVKIHSVRREGEKVFVHYAGGGADQVLEVDRLIVSIGRIPNTEGLNAEAVGLQVDVRGYIDVDDHCRTNLPNVWAVGDVVRGPMLAHKAMEEGVMVAEEISGQSGHVNMDAIPWIIYTHPEIAWVGKTEKQLIAAGIAYRSGQIPFAANGRALSQGDPTGFVKILADAKTDRVLGMHIVGNNASELVMEGVMAIEFGATSEDIARLCHGHPTLSEAVHEAALAVDKRPLHF